MSKGNGKFQNEPYIVQKPKNRHTCKIPYDKNKGKECREKISTKLQTNEDDNNQSE